MEQHLDAFIEAHPDGWDHDSWLGLLSELDDGGFDVSDAESVGAALERRRLAWELRRRAVPGLGPKRIEAVVDRFGTLWSLQHAEVDELAEIKTIPSALAEKVVASIR